MTNRQTNTTAAPASASVADAARPPRRAMATSAPPVRRAADQKMTEEPSICGTRLDATAPASGGAITRAHPANVSASVRSGALVAASRQSANVTLTTCSQNQNHPR